MKTLKTIVILFVLLSHQLVWAQSLDKIAKLDPKLGEISGLDFWNDTVLIAHNDSGNEPILYFLDLKGNLFHQVKITNASNVDWEDLATDGKGTIYIADIGNNSNRRQDLTIYIIKENNILRKSEAKAQSIHISYADQKAFPPENKTDWHFDAEAMGFYRDSLFIFTKSQSKPFDGVSHCYKLPAKAGNFTLKPFQKLNLKDRSYRQDAVTSVDFLDGKCYLLTYSGIEILDVPAAGKLTYDKRISFLLLSQKEALTLNRSYIYIADEYHKKVGGRNLYQLKNE
ncbi:MAG: hypothetical protein K0R65_1266 [Crocinitomicaceae bacterium]|jgi:hypothetical protein|nr:hypothetical protein [Crocinitomicaceae bacterium]